MESAQPSNVEGCRSGDMTCDCPQLSAQVASGIDPFVYVPGRGSREEEMKDLEDEETRQGSDNISPDLVIERSGSTNDETSSGELNKSVLENLLETWFVDWNNRGLVNIQEGEKQYRVLFTLGVSEYSQFESSGDVDKITKAINHWEAAIALTPTLNEDKLVLLSNLGSAHYSRFRHLGKISDLDGAIHCETEAVLLTSNGHSRKPERLSNLGASYQARFDHLDDIPDLHRAIECRSEAVSLTPDGHPNKAEYLSNLGKSYTIRFRRLDELSDLNLALKCGVEALSLTPKGHSGRPECLNSLGIAYVTRFERLGEILDLNKAVEYGAEVVSLTPDTDPGKPGYLSNLGNLYATRFENVGKLSDLNKAIEYGIQALSLIAGDHAENPVILNNLGISYKDRFECLGKLADLDRAIECQAEVVLLTPHNHPSKPTRLNNLGITYGCRFGHLGKLSDLNKAVDYKLEAVLHTPDGHPGKPARLNNLGVSYETRFELLGELPDIGKAIEYKTRAISLTPNGHPDRPEYLHNLGVSYLSQFERLDELSDLDSAINCSAEAVSLASQGHPHMPKYLDNLGSAYATLFERLGRVADLEKAIEHGTEAVLLTPDGHPDKPGYMNNLGQTYTARYNSLDELSDLNRAIEYGTKALSLIPNGHPDKPSILSNLGMRYRTRYQRLNESLDIQSAVASFRRAAQSSTGSPSLRFHACRLWALLSSSALHSPQAAYKQAMELLPQLIWIGTTLDHRYELIAELGDFATEAASHAISSGAYGLALEWLEAGRSIVWGQIAQLRTPFDQLYAKSPELAAQLTEIGQRLEQAGSRSATLSVADTEDRDLSVEASTRQRLALDWDTLLTEARSIPEFKDFLRPPTSSQLLDAAKFHPVAVINIYKSSCSALILQPGSEIISHVPLMHFSARDATMVRDRVVALVRTRKLGPPLRSVGPLESSMESLWSGIVKPVLDFLGYTKDFSADQLPRLTWCTTGLLSFLPFHAARSYKQSQAGTFDLVISSYTPTLSALLSSQLTDPSAYRSVLAVGQEHTPGLESLPGVKVELEAIKKFVPPHRYLQLEDSGATVSRVLEAMNKFSWVHMACHGSQDTTAPTQSAFHLCDGGLTLATITKQKFKNKGLAFLSACQTATGDESVPNEAVHLAAGMLMAGYPSVIGTMWSIADEDGPEVAGQVYADLLNDGATDHTRAARALHQAVAQLRAKVGVNAIARWAPFIHIGF